MLELPTSVKLNIKKIDCVSQLITATDPDHCLPRQLQYFNISASPFQFSYTYLYGYSLFNCTSPMRSYLEKMDCLSFPGFYVYVLYTDGPLSPLDLMSCTKMYNISSFPDEIIRGNNGLYLNWTRPACGFCEARGKYCKLKGNTSVLGTECFDKPKSPRGTTKKIVATATTIGLFLLVLVVLAFYRRYSSDKAAKENQERIENFLEDYKALKPARYSYADIKRITNDFKESLGQGTYGKVFKGKLSDEIYVAVKILNNSTGNGEEFINEVGTMGNIHHFNIVRLVGYCADGFKRALVYEYLANESLENFISSDHGKSMPLGWKKLQDIALGVARGIEYRHQGCDQRILHFDIKPHNILLDGNFNPKISDFGLAKLCSKDQSAVSMTTARGTMGYIAPEVFSRNFGNVSYNSDVYSFGMVLLEMVGGRKNIEDTTENTSQVYFPEWIYNCLDGGEELRLRIQEEKDVEIGKKLAIVGLWCIQWHPMDRPSMKTVIQMLKEEGNRLTMPPSPFASPGPGRTKANMAGRRLPHDLVAISETE